MPNLDPIPAKKTVRHELVLATHNEGKILELRELLQDLPWEISSVREALGRPFEVVEDGATLRANAEKKARAVAHATGHIALADDSGLEVDELQGRPGVYSARFSGPDATDESNRRALLSALRHCPGKPLSRARFRCALCLHDPRTGQTEFVDGICEGTIIAEPRGEGGFGYDPLFIPEGETLTMAELPLARKNELSHRARAFRALKPLLVDLASG